MSATSEAQGQERDPFWEIAQSLAEQHESGLSEEDTPLFLRYMRGKVNPEDLSEETRQYFERVNTHLHIDALLRNLDPKLHDVAVSRRKRDNRTMFMAQHVRETIAPQLEAAFSESKDWPHGFHYESHDDVRELLITEGFCLGVLLVLADLRQRMIEEQYGGPSNPRTE